MNKIEALKKTIYNLESGEYDYEWGEPNSCNCGILCHSITGGDVEIKVAALFTEAAKCMKTGIAVPAIFKILMNTGFTYKDIHELEFLSNSKIAKRAGIEIDTRPSSFGWCTKRVGRGFSNKETVIDYLKAWVSILEESSQMLSKGQEVQVSDTTKPIVAMGWPNKSSSFTNLIPVVSEVQDSITTKESVK